MGSNYSAGSKVDFLCYDKYGITVPTPVMGKEKRYTGFLWICNKLEGRFIYNRWRSSGANSEDTKQENPYTWFFLAKRN